MRIFICGDIHGSMDISKLSSDNFPEGKLLSKSDYVIIVGDFGILWKHSMDKEEEYWINWLSFKPWTTLFIDGNHENFDRLECLRTVQKFGADVGEVNGSIYHLRRGRIYTIGEKTFFTMGGAASIDVARRTAFTSWWPQEVPNWKECDDALGVLDKHEHKVDFILTHTAPKSVISKIPKCHGDKLKDPTAEFLEVVLERTTYQKWFAGHFHVDMAFAQERLHILFNNLIEI